MPSRVLTIMFTDISGFTETTSASSRKELRNLINKHDDLLLPVLDRFNGSLIKTIGDALMVTFESPTNAVLCGMMMQEKLRQHNDEHPDDQKLAIRVAINQGEVEVIGEDVYGEAVNIAARIEGITEPGEIFFTEAVYLSMNKAEVPSSEVDEYRLKGLPESVRVYRVIRDENSAEYRKRIEDLTVYFNSKVDDSGVQFARVKTGPKTGVKIGIISAVVILIAITTAIGGAYIMGRSNTPPAPPTPDTAALMQADIQEVNQMLQNDQIDQAMNKAEALLDKYPGESKILELNNNVVRTEIDKQTKLHRYDDAVELIKQRAEDRPWLQQSELIYEVKMKQAERFLELKYARNLDTLFHNMLKEFPNKTELWYYIIDAAYELYPDTPTQMYSITPASLYIMRNTEEPLDDKIASILYDEVNDRRLEDTFTQEIRQILSNRDPKYLERVTADTQAKNGRLRHNAWVTLRDAGKLTLQQEIEAYLDILENVTFIRDPMFVMAIDKLTEFTSADDWASTRESLKLKPMSNVAFLTYKNKHENHKRARELMLTHFPDLITPWLLQSVNNSEHTAVRANSWDIVNEINLVDRVDLKKFHSFTLERRFNPAFNAALNFTAIEYMASRVEPDDKSHAIEVLTKARAYCDTVSEKVSQSTEREEIKQRWNNQIDIYIKALDAALAQLGVSPEDNENNDSVPADPDEVEAVG